MFVGPRILQLVAFLDMILAISLFCYVGVRFSQGFLLVPGHISESERLSRLIVYVTLLYVFLGIQLYMALRLLRTTRWIFEEPLQSMKDITAWLEWSSFYLIFIVIHGATALLLMQEGKRKSIIMAISGIQIGFRIVGLSIVAKHHHIKPPEPMKV